MTDLLRPSSEDLAWIISSQQVLEPMCVTEFLQGFCCHLYLGFDSAALFGRNSWRRKGLVEFLQPRLDVKDVSIYGNLHGWAPMN